MKNEIAQLALLGAPTSTLLAFSIMVGQAVLCAILIAKLTLNIAAFLISRRGQRSMSS